MDDIVFAYDKKIQNEKEKEIERRKKLLRIEKSNELFLHYLNKNNILFNLVSRMIIFAETKVELSGDIELELWNDLNVCDDKRVNKNILYDKLCDEIPKLDELFKEYNKNINIRTTFYSYNDNITIEFYTSSEINKPISEEKYRYYYVLCIKYLYNRIWEEIKQKNDDDISIEIQKVFRMEEEQLNIMLDIVSYIFEQYGYFVSYKKHVSMITKVNVSYRDTKKSYKGEKKDKCPTCFDKTENKNRKKCGHFVHFKCLKIIKPMEEEEGEKEKELKKKKPITENKKTIRSMFSKFFSNNEPNNKQNKIEIKRNLLKFECPTCRKMLIQHDYLNEQQCQSICDIYNYFI